MSEIERGRAEREREKERELKERESERERALTLHHTPDKNITALFIGFTRNAIQAIHSVDGHIN